jgi:hypothetical protein
MAGFTLSQQGAKCHPFSDRGALGLQQFAKAHGHVLGYEAQPEAQTGFKWCRRCGSSSRFHTSFHGNLESEVAIETDGKSVPLLLVPAPFMACQLRH